jgi:hypothetical protein
MLRSVKEVVSKGKLNRGEPIIAVGKKKKNMQKPQQQQQQQHSWREARGEIQGKIWDPGGFQHRRRGSHELELMIFPAVEYDVGASLHLNNMPAFQHISVHFREGEALILPFLNLKYIPYRFIL